MKTTTMDFVIRAAVDSAKKAELITSSGLVTLPPFALRLLGWYVRPKFQKAAAILADMCLKMETMTQQVQNNREEALVDASMGLRDRLGELKNGATSERASLIKVFGADAENLRGYPAFQKEILTLINLAQEVRTSASSLQWALAEHDADYAARESDCVASSADELDALLTRIYSAA